MSGGKKVKRGRTAKKKQAEAAVMAVKRKTGFIETSDGPERVLPIEIRREIYRYLLLGRNVKRQREYELWKTKGFADYYDFQVNILRTCKTICAETREVLYGENIFAVLSTKDPAFPAQNQCHVIPFVSYNFDAVDRFFGYSLYMRFEGPIRDDLPAFFRLCRTINHMDPDPTFFVVDQPQDGTFGFRRLCEKRQPSFASIKFKNNTNGIASTGFVERTLTQLRKVTGDRCIEIDAPSHARLAAECKDAMMPKVVWGYAIAWDLIEVSRECKMEADEMIRRSSAEPDQVDRLATKLYEFILKLLGNSMVLRRLGLQASTFEQQLFKSEDWTESWSLLNLDLAVACMCLNLFSGSDDSAEAHMQDVLKFKLQCSRPPDETVAHAYHVMAFLHTKKGNCREALRSLKLARTHRKLSGLNPDEGLEQDTKRHVNHIKTNGQLGKKGTDSCHFLCCSSFAGETYVAKDSRFDGVKPTGISAWQDHEYQLTEKDLKAMGVTRKDVPPPLPRIRKTKTFVDPSDQLEAMDLNS